MPDKNLADPNAEERFKALGSAMARIEIERGYRAPQTLEDDEPEPAVPPEDVIEPWTTAWRDWVAAFVGLLLWGAISYFLRISLEAIVAILAVVAFWTPFAPIPKALKVFSITTFLLETSFSSSQFSFLAYVSIYLHFLHNSCKIHHSSLILCHRFVSSSPSWP